MRWYERGQLRCAAQRGRLSATPGQVRNGPQPPMFGVFPEIDIINTDGTQLGCGKSARVDIRHRGSDQRVMRLDARRLHRSRRRATITVTVV